MGRPAFRVNRDLFQAQDQKASGNAGGAFTSGSWQKRVLQTILTNELGVTLVADEVVGLKAGYYEVLGSAPAYAVGRHQLRLYDVTGAAELRLGPNAYNNTPGEAASTAWVRGRFTLAATSTVRLEHRCSSTFSNGLGLAHSWGVEVYADLQIRFLGT